MAQDAKAVIADLNKRLHACFAPDERVGNTFFWLGPEGIVGGYFLSETLLMGTLPAPVFAQIDIEDNLHRHYLNFVFIVARAIGMSKATIEARLDRPATALANSLDWVTNYRLDADVMEALCIMRSDAELAHENHARLARKETDLTYLDEIRAAWRDQGDKIDAISAYNNTRAGAKANNPTEQSVATYMDKLRAALDTPIKETPIMGANDLRCIYGTHPEPKVITGDDDDHSRHPLLDAVIAQTRLTTQERFPLPVRLPHPPAARAPAGFKPVWPDPTPEMLADPLFDAIWKVIKGWDVNVLGVYSGYCCATGNHVRAIYEGIVGLRDPKAEPAAAPLPKKPRVAGDRWSR